MSNRDGALIYRDLANLLAGRDPTGAPAAGAGVVSREEVVTQTEPVLMTRPVTSAPGAASASVRATDAVRGVHVGDLVIVETRGVADRVATAAVTPRPLTDRAAGDQVATIGAKTVAVGESVTLSQIGATPDGIGAAPTSHTHTIPSTSCAITITGTDVGTPDYNYFDDAVPGSYSTSYMNASKARINDLYSWVNQLRTRLNQISGTTYTCDGCGKAGPTT